MDLAQNHTFITAIAFILGMLFGSFATMASHRIPLGEELVFTPSHCPKCGHKLGFFDLFPVFSWLFNKGRCRYCKSPVHFRYPATELLMAFLFAIQYWNLGATLQCAILLLTTACLVISFVIEIEKRMVSKLMITSLLILGLLHKYSINSPIIEYFLIPLSAFITLNLVNYLHQKFKKNKTIPTDILNFLIVILFFIEIENILIFFTVLFGIGITLYFLTNKFNKNVHLSITLSIIISLLFYNLMR